ARKELDDLGYGGFDIDETKVRVDFETTSEIDDATLTELERLTNTVVWESRDVTWREIPKEDALAKDEIAFNAATQEGVFESSETIRIVEIDDWDLAACGGTHVQNRNEIDLVTILDRSNPGEGLTRVEFSVGPPAIDHQTEQRAASRAAAKILAAPIEDIDEAVKELQDQKANIEQERDQLQQKLVESELATLETIERDGSKLAIGTVTIGNVNDISDQLRSKVGNGLNGALVVGQQDTTFIVAATDGSINANAIIQDVTEKFGGGGGGQNTFAQGGGLTVPPDDVITFIRSDLTFG
ncbi:MAG: DHHA1 domain-containing protein, partial [Halobacteriaceae archaeon]